MNNLNFWSLLNESCFPHNRATLQKVKLRTQRRCPTPQSVTSTWGGGATQSRRGAGELLQLVE